PPAKSWRWQRRPTSVFVLLLRNPSCSPFPVILVGPTRGKICDELITPNNSREMHRQRIESWLDGKPLVGAANYSSPVASMHPEMVVARWSVAVLSPQPHVRYVTDKPPKHTLSSARGSLFTRSRSLESSACPVRCGAS